MPPGLAAKSKRAIAMDVREFTSIGARNRKPARLGDGIDLGSFLIAGSRDESEVGPCNFQPRIKFILGTTWYLVH